MSLTPTQEQADFLDATATGENVSLVALAGTGKTASLKLDAQHRWRKEMCYVAFNRAIADEAKRRFPSNVTARTAHGFAYQFVMNSRPDLKDRLENQARVPRWRVVQILRIPPQFTYGSFRLREGQLAGLVNEAVGRFCSSAETLPLPRHIPKVPGLIEPDARRALEEFVFPYVLRAWEDMISDNGQLRFTHDVYLKLASMDPNFRLPGEVVLFDEAQDADPVVLEIVRRMQAEHGAQIISVGDENQAIYEWRGSIDALAQFDAAYRLPLTQSFRFGPEIAEEANRILSLLPTPLRVRGLESKESRLAVLHDPDTVLCRTNAEAVARLLVAQVNGVSAGLVGGTQAVEWLAKAALDLTQGRPTDHPELRAFSTWGQVQQYADEEKDARDLQVLVRLVDRHGPEVMLEAVNRAVPEQAAELLISTAHKSKGREWGRVLLASDFASPVSEEDGMLSEAELRLAYVAATRAQDYLDSRIFTPWFRELVAPDQMTDRVLLDPAEVAPRAVERVVVDVAQVMCDPESEHRVIMTGTKYDPELVAAQKTLASDMRPSYRGEYCGFEKVRIVNAGWKVMQVVERFGLTITDSARERILNYS